MVRFFLHGRRGCRLAFGVLLVFVLAQSARAQSTGVLLGIDGESGARTLWITRDHAGRVAVSSELPRLLVPRSDGFWWVDVDRRCGIMEPGEGEEENRPAFIEKSGWVVHSKVDGDDEPLDENPNFRDCNDVEQQLLKRPGEPRDPMTLYCSYSISELTHVSGRNISYRQLSQSTEFCNPAKYSASVSLHVQDFDRQDVKLLSALAPAERTSLVERWERQRGDCALESAPDDSWAIAPFDGKWRASFATSGAIACKGDPRGSEEGITVTTSVPSSIVKQDSLEPWHGELRRRLKSIDIVFISPKRDWLIASSGRQVLAFTPSGRALGGPVLTLQLAQSERIVMGEWSVGVHAQRWTAEVARLESAQKPRRDVPVADHHVHMRSAAMAVAMERAREHMNEGGAGPLAAVGASEVVAALDSAGVDRAAVFSSAYLIGMPHIKFQHEQQSVEAENEFVSAEVSKKLRRLVGFCSVNPLADYAVAEIRRCSRFLGMIGINLHFANSNVDLRDDRHIELLKAVFREAQTLRRPIVVHMQTGRADYGAVDARCFIGDVLGEAPSIHVQVAHMAGGGGYHDGADEAMGVFIDAFRRDPSLRDRISFDLSGVVHPPAERQGIGYERLVQRIREVGPERVLFASDLTSLSVSAAADRVIRWLPVTPGELQTILHNRASYLRRNPRGPE